MLWRQGDVFIAECAAIPVAAVKQPDRVLAEGEISGHSHRIDDPAAANLYRHGAILYLEILREQAMVVHEEHGPVALPRGHYRVWRQREYRPSARSRVAFVQD